MEKEKHYVMLIAHNLSYHSQDKCIQLSHFVFCLTNNPREALVFFAVNLNRSKKAFLL